MFVFNADILHQMLAWERNDKHLMMRIEYTDFNQQDY